MRITEILKPLQEINPFLSLFHKSNGTANLTTDISVKEIPDFTDKYLLEEDNSGEIISKLKLTNKLLAYNVNKFEIVLDNLNDGVIVLDSSTRILAINHIMEQLLNLKREDIKGKHIRECNCDNKIFSFILENFESINKLVEKTEEMSIGTSNLRVSYKTLIRSDGNPCGTILLAKDITSNKLTEQAMVEFLSHVSHEVKTPLNTIKSYTEMLIDTNNRETILEFCNIVNGEVDRLACLINNLLQLSRIEMGSVTLSLTMTKTKEFIENAFKIAISQKKRDIKYEIILPDKISPVNIDKEFMGIALINLIGNAIKYTPEHGRVTLRVEEDQEEGKIIIHVIDTGIGISEEDLPQVFEKFYRSSDEKVREMPGHGLGLSITKQIVDLHDGEIKVISKKGEGSQFSIILPISESYFLE
jgi:two-component system phosphate regulon sensor histidine kinase PhoR